MFIIAGLGNPGDKYKNTRHNIGFLVIDAITKNLSTTTINNPKFKALTQKTASQIFIKPQTYMNLSGESIVVVANYYDIATEDIIVIHDDLDLPFGAVRLKRGGGHGGHNGLKSLDSHLGKEYLRVRVGIGKPHNKEVADYVLSDFSKEEQGRLEGIIDHCARAVEMLMREPLEKVQSLYTLK